MSRWQRCGSRGAAHAAAARGAWQEAFELFVDADAAGLLGLADLPVFGNAAYGAGHLDTTIEVWERAYAGLRAAGELVAGGGRSRAGGDAPAVRHRAHGTGPRLARPSGAAARRRRRDARARVGSRSSAATSGC